tara:strand:+ start:145 stop:255 length:111 start_codon:yes stop_codon:yes gene_type:complete
MKDKKKEEKKEKTPTKKTNEKVIQVGHGKFKVVKIK